MANNSNIINRIVTNTSKTSTFEVIQDLHLDGNWENELLLFVKPEVFMVNDDHLIARSIELVFNKIEEFRTTIDGIMVVGGRTLEQFGIMDKHYGFINQMSRNASKILTSEDIQKVSNALDISVAQVEKQYVVLGGHEFLNRYPSEDPYKLDNLWFTKKSLKLRSGMYIQSYEYNGEKVILINGFHPSQLLHFTDPSHRILLFLLHSDTTWKKLKNDMVGNTYPEKAEPGSIRGKFFSNPGEYGLKDVSIAYNNVHLSAGPFEGMFEISNFFGKILNLNLSSNHPLVLKKLLDKGISLEEGLSTLENPLVNVGAKTVDLFTATEDTDTDVAISLWQKGK